jgi:chlorobactene glucosyltransferase
LLSLLTFALVLTAVCTTLGWAFVVVRSWRAIGALERLPHHPSDDVALPRVSVVLAARNEEMLIERCVRSILAAEGVDLELIAVDDASEDRTHEILMALAAQDERLVVLRNDRLPTGWVAKNYALELGQGRADGDYLLFTDADVVVGRRAIANAVRVLDARKLDHLTLHPRLEASTLIEAVVLPLYFLLCEFRFIDPRAALPTSGVGAGIGAFNLVRAESYRLRGTHARIRGAVLDDRALGRMMRDDGGRGTVMRAVTQVRMRPYRGLGELYVGIRKGVLSAFGNSAVVAASMGALLAFAAVVPPLLFASAGAWVWQGEVPWASFVAVTGFALPVLGLFRTRAMVKFWPPAAVLFPLGALIIAAAAFHAAVVFGARGTVEWRGREYSRADLREMGY